jgi:hypothetical protein
MSLNVEIGDQFKEYLYSDRRETTSNDYKIGVVKSFKSRLGTQFVVITFERKNQLKITTEIEISNLQRQGEFLVRI